MFRYASCESAAADLDEAGCGRICRVQGTSDRRQATEHDA